MQACVWALLAYYVVYYLINYDFADGYSSLWFLYKRFIVTHFQII
jgi:hypothetical protein